MKFLSSSWFRSCSHAKLWFWSYDLNSWRYELGFEPSLIIAIFTPSCTCETKLGWLQAFKTVFVRISRSLATTPTRLTQRNRNWTRLHMQCLYTILHRLNQDWPNPITQGRVHAHYCLFGIEANNFDQTNSVLSKIQNEASLRYFAQVQQSLAHFELFWPH